MAWWKYLCCLCLFAQEPEQLKNASDQDKKHEQLLNHQDAIAQGPERSTILSDDDTGSLIGYYFSSSCWTASKINRWIDNVPLQVSAGFNSPPLAKIDTSGYPLNSHFYAQDPFAHRREDPKF